MTIKLTFFILLLHSALSYPSAFNDYEYLSPKPNAKMSPCQSQIMLRLKDISPRRHLANLDNCIKITGSKSGHVNGRSFIASDDRTIIFQPHTPFQADEQVRVQIILKDKNASHLGRSLDYSFNTTATFDGHSVQTHDDEKHVDAKPLEKSIARSRRMPNGVSVPGDFPHVRVLENNNPADGYIFICNRDGDPKYNMILQNDGSPIWYMRTSDNRRDFKVQDNGNLSMLVRSGYPFGTGYIELDQNYAVIDSFHATNGYSSDEHGIQILENGNYLLMGRREDQVDMSLYVVGGRANATVRETCIQEFTANHELIFQWAAWDYFDIRDTYVPGENELTGGYIRFPHMNAVDIDSDGHILLSSRHHSEVTKINRQTGDIIWRLSGPKNQFTFVGDPLNGFENQHDIRNVGPNRYTVFDNGNEHNPPQTRAVEYELNTNTMTARLVWQYKNSGDHYSHYMGNAQRLPHGNTFINWAASRSDQLSQLITESTPGGDVAYRLEFRQKSDCYRAFRFPWNGKATKPNLFIDPQFDNITLGFNLFGDDVAFYKIYGGTRRNPTTVLDTSRATLKKLQDLQNKQRTYFRVTAVRNDGSESDFSVEKDVLVNIFSPTSNMVINGDFSTGISAWSWQLNDPAKAEFRVRSGVAQIRIIDGGANDHDIHIRQNGMPLTNGRTYLFEFDAWADAARIIEAKVGQDEDPWINYSKIGYTALTAREKRFSFEFAMNDASDTNARIVFNCGSDANNVYIDNVSLKMVTDSDVQTARSIPSAFQLYQNVPNPFNPTTTIAFDLPTSEHTKIDVFNMLGRHVKSVIDDNVMAGHHVVQFDASELSSGVYVYRIVTPSFQHSKKMLLIR